MARSCVLGRRWERERSFGAGHLGRGQHDGLAPFRCYHGAIFRAAVVGFAPTPGRSALKKRLRRLPSVLRSVLFV